MDSDRRPSPGGDAQQSRATLQKKQTQDFELLAESEERMSIAPLLCEVGACLSFFVIVNLILLVPSPPHQRPIPFQMLSRSGDYVRNLSINENFEGETVSDLLLKMVGVVCPLSLQCALGSVRRRSEAGPSILHIHATLCVYLMSTSLNQLATECIKRYVGYLRPIFYDQCVPNGTYDFCMAADEGGDSIRKSFPSGHASMSFAGLTLLTLYIHSQFGMGFQRNKLQRQERLARHAEPSFQRQLAGQTTYNFFSRDLFQARIISLLGLLPMALALFIASSRVYDNKHFPADIVGGSVLGASIASFVHGLWF